MGSSAAWEVGSLDDLSPHAQDMFAKYEKNGWNGNVPGYTKGTKAGAKYGNNNSLLPTVDSKGNPITYKEFDVNNKIEGEGRDGERFVVGSDGSVYYTDSHYGQGQSLNGFPPFLKIK